MTETQIPYVLAILPGIAPSTLMDVVNPLKQLEKQGKLRTTITVDWLVTEQEIKQADLVVFCRNNSPDYCWANFLKEHNIPYIYDLDDNLFAIPDHTPLGQYANRADVLDSLKAYLRNASLIRVYSDVLKEVILPYNPNTHLVRPPIDWQIIRGLEQKRGPKIKIVYPTSRGAMDDLAEIFLPAIKRIALEFSREVEIYFLGAPIPDQLKSLPNVKHWPFTLNYDDYMRRFYQEGFDIGLAPLREDLFYQCKTNNKFREFAACGIAGIYSNTSLYTQSVTHKSDGLIVNDDSEEWYQAIRLLIENVELRQSIQTASLNKVKSDYPEGAFAEAWLNEIERVLFSHANLAKEIESKTFNQVNSTSIPSFAPSPSNGLLTRIRNILQSLATGGLNYIVHTLGWKIQVWKMKKLLNKMNKY